MASEGKLGLTSNLGTVEDVSKQTDSNVIGLVDSQIGIELASTDWSLHNSGASETSAGAMDGEGDTYIINFDADNLRLGNTVLDIVDVRFAGADPTDIGIDIVDATIQRSRGGARNKSIQLHNYYYGFSLARAESLAECIISPGTFFYDRRASYSFGAWDDDVSVWDGTDPVWDGGSYTLYVNMPDPLHNSTANNVFEDPSDYTILARLNATFSTDGGSYPYLYEGVNSKLTDGALEDWASATNLTSWTESTANGGSVNQEQTTILKGSNSANCESDGGTNDPHAAISQDVTTVVGSIYRFSGAYYIDEVSEPTWKPYVRVEDDGGTVHMLTDGRNTTTSTGVGNEWHLLNGDKGRWHRFSFDYRAYDVDTKLGVIGWNAAGGDSPSGKIYFDDLKHQVISAFERYEPRLDANSIPSIASGTNDVIFGGKIISNATVKLLNMDEDLYDLFGNTSSVEGISAVTTIGHELSIQVGYSSKTRSVPRDDFDTVFAGNIESLKMDDKAATIKALSFASLLRENVPPNRIDAERFTEVREQDEGKLIPLAFGNIENIEPTRFKDAPAFNGDAGGTQPNPAYPIYLISDPAFGADINSDVATVIDNGGGTPSTNNSELYSYTDKDSADNLVTTKRKIVPVKTTKAGFLGFVDNRDGLLPFFFDAKINEIVSAGNSQGTNQTTNVGLHQNNLMDFDEAGGSTGGYAATKVWRVAAGGPTFTDETTDFNDAGAADCQPFPGTEAIGDYFAVGYSVPFDYIRFVFSTARAGGEMVWEFHDGTSWKPLTIKSNNTQDMVGPLTPAGRVVWERPEAGTWDTFSLNGTSAYWVRAKVVEQFTTNPIITQGWIGVILTATLTDGLYFPSTLSDEIETQFNAESIAGNSYLCSYDDNGDLAAFTLDAHEYGIKGTNAFDVLLKSGPNNKLTPWRLFGIAENDDATALTEYSSGAVYTDDATDWILRCNINGYEDDSKGTWTGTGSTAGTPQYITKGPDIIRFLLARVFGMNINKYVDNVAFDTLRSTAKTLNLYLNENQTLLDVASELELSDLSEYIFEGGKIGVQSLTGITALETIDDEDIKTYEADEKLRDVAKITEIEYNVDPSRRRGRVRRSDNPTALGRFSNRRRMRRRVRVISGDEALTIANAIGNLNQAVKRIHVISTNRLITRKYGDRVTLNRSSGMGQGGALSSVSCKIIKITKSYMNRTSKIFLYEE